MKNETVRGRVTKVHACYVDRPWMAGVATAVEDLKPCQVNGRTYQTRKGSDFRFSGKVAADVGDEVELAGTWSKHPRFGLGFEADSGLVKMDESPTALVHLLATNKTFREVGPARAQKIVDAALAISGDGEFSEALINEPDQIAQRSGVKLEIVKAAADAWDAKRETFGAMTKLVEFGWSNTQAAKIVAKFGPNAPAVIDENPYMLIGRIARFGFKTVDIVAKKMGVPSNSPFRLQAGVAYCLDRIADQGNTWTTRKGLLEEAMEQLQPDTLDGEEAIRKTILEMIELGMIVVEVSPKGLELVADARLAQIEADVFGELIPGLQAVMLDTVSMDGPRAQGVLASLNEGQRSALLGFAQHEVTVISGGAGVGKTYTQRAICEVAEENGMRVELCAPTGKAARKLHHATQREARTIHKMLEPMMNPTTGAFEFQRNAKNTLDADLVVVDEVSMVDVRLMRSLLLALPPKCRLLLVGDHNQIPSVGPGSILRDLLAARGRYSESIHVLREIVRQAGILARNTTAVLDGVLVQENVAAWSITKSDHGHKESSANMVACLVDRLVTSPTIIEPFQRELELAWDVQVLAPMRKGPVGTYAMNVELQKLRQRLLGNPPPEATPENRSPKPLAGDRIIWTQNDYDLDLLNGTQAIVMGLPKGGSMEIYTEDGREVTVPAKKRDRVEVAYAMTIHKSQGSEWPCVVLCGSTSHTIMHDRNLFYTGASRASEALYIFGDMPGLKRFAKEQRSARRQTFGALFVHGWQMQGSTEGR